MRRRLTALTLAAAMLLSSCGGNDSNDSNDSNGGTGSDGAQRDDDTEATTTTTIPPAYQQVIDARREAHEQYEQARANPTNPENPTLRDYFTGVELMNIIRRQVFNNDENGNGVKSTYPEDSRHRFDIESVTFSDSDPNVAWLETCWVDDGVDSYINTGAPTAVGNVPAIRTIQSTEEMRKESDRWKVAKTFINSYQEGATGCASDDDYNQRPYSQPDATNELTQTITDARTAAEQAYVSYLTDPNYTAYSDTWTGFQHDYYFANAAFGSDEHKNPDGNYCPSDVTLIATSATSGEYRQFYLQDDSLNPWRTDPYYGYDGNRYNESPCYNDYQLGQNAWAFSIRNNGTTLDPSTASTVAVKSVQLQAIENPHVAYLTTCRTYNFVPTQPGNYPHLQGTVASTETVHLVDGEWKVSNRWNFAITDTCTT